MTKKIPKLFQKNEDAENNYHRSCIIASIIKKREYVVSTEFIKVFVDKSVIDILLMDFCDYIRRTPVSDLIDNVSIWKFSSLYKKMDDLYPKLQLFSRKYLKRLDNSVIAIILLKTDSQWKSWLKIYPKYISSAIYGHLILTQFHQFKKPIPKYLLRCFVNDRKRLNVIETYFEHGIGDGASTELIKSIEKLNVSTTTYIHYLCVYWSKGGTYFPEQIERVVPYLDSVPTFKECLNIFKKNLPDNNLSLGYETYRILQTMTVVFDDLGTIDDENSIAMTNVVDHLFFIAKRDINIFWAMINTNMPSFVYQDFLRGTEYVDKFLELVKFSEVPLKNAQLFFKLFGCTKMKKSDQLEFLKRGGCPSTLTLDSDSDDLIYNVCYTQDGLREILSNSDSLDIKNLMDFNEKFRDFLISEMNNCSLNYLSEYQLRVLFCCIVDRKYETHESLKLIANYIFRLIGEETMLRKYPYSMKLLMDNRLSKMVYPVAVQHLNSETLPYVPIRLLSGDIVSRCLMKKLDGINPPVLNMDSSYLDFVMTEKQLDLLFFDRKNIGYIADLSVDRAEYYIQALASSSKQSETKGII